MVDIDLDKISRVLLQPAKNLVLKIHIKLLNEKDGRKENFHQLYTFNGNKYLKLDLQSFMTLEFNNGDEWAKDKSIVINQKNIYQIIRGFEKVLDNIYNGGVFAINKQNEVIIYKDMVEKYTQRIYNLGGEQRLVIKPAIIYDENELTYEGVVIYMNKTENFIELPIDAFESLVYTLNKVDLFVYSQMLLNYYMSAIKDQKIELKEVSYNEKGSFTKKQKSIFLENVEEVKGNLTKPQSDEEIFNFKTKGEEKI